MRKEFRFRIKICSFTMAVTILFSAIVCASNLKFQKKKRLQFRMNQIRTARSLISACMQYTSKKQHNRTAHLICQCVCNATRICSMHPCQNAEAIKCALALQLKYILIALSSRSLLFPQTKEVVRPIELQGNGVGVSKEGVLGPANTI